MTTWKESLDDCLAAMDYAILPQRWIDKAKADWGRDFPELDVPQRNLLEEAAAMERLTRMTMEATEVEAPASGGSAEATPRPGRDEQGRAIINLGPRAAPVVVDPKASAASGGATPGRAAPGGAGGTPWPFPQRGDRAPQAPGRECCCRRRDARCCFWRRGGGSRVRAPQPGGATKYGGQRNGVVHGCRSTRPPGGESANRHACPSGGCGARCRGAQRGGVQGPTTPTSGNHDRWKMASPREHHPQARRL